MVLKIQIILKLSLFIPFVSQSVTQNSPTYRKRKKQLPALLLVYRPCQRHLVHNTYLTFSKRYLPHVTSLTVKGICLHPCCSKC